MIRRGGVETEITKLQLSFEKNNNSIKSYTNELDNLNERLALYHENKETIENLHKLKDKIAKDEQLLSHVENEIEECEEQLITLHKQDAYEEKFVTSKSRNSNSKSTDKTYSAYDLFKAVYGQGRHFL